MHRRRCGSVLLATGDNQTFNTVGLPVGIGTDRVYTNPDDNKADFHNVEFAVNRRFRVSG